MSVLYSEQVLNLADVSAATINVVGNWWMSEFGDLNEIISLDEVRKEVNEMKSGKAPGLDGYPVDCLKRWYGSVIIAS